MSRLREKTTATLLIAIFMISIFAVIAPVFATDPDAVWVSTNGLDTNPGTESEPFLTIQKGIDTVADHGTVNVLAGIYQLVKYPGPEEVKIVDKSLTLFGAQANVPIVDGERAGEESIIRGWVNWRGDPLAWCVIRITHSDVVVNGFTIEKGRRGIAIQDPCEDILISYNYIVNNGKYSSEAGIFRDDAAVDVTIDHNYIASNPIGIATRGGATTITDNTFYGNGKGIDFKHGDPSDMYYSDYAEPKYPTIISGNTFTNDRTSIKLSLRGHQPITITGNDITEARTVAIETSGWYEGNLVNPAIHYNNIWNNEFGINNQVEEINLDATLNWWGHNSGPYHPDTNPDGLGDAVSDYVDYEPWLTIPTISWTISNIDEEVAHPGVANSLTSKLQNALKALDRGNINAFENILNAFINQVEAQSGKKIEAEYAATLIEWANAWIGDSGLAE